MRKDLRKNRKRCSVFGVILLIGSLLLSGCTCKLKEQKQTQPTETTMTTETLVITQDTQTDDTEPIVNKLDDPSLTDLKQEMEIHQLFAAAFFGYVAQNTDPFDFMREAAPRLCEEFPFLLTVQEENVVGTYGHLFCIVPSDEKATVAVNRRPWNPETEKYEEPEVLYRSESGAPILVMCPNEDWIPDTEVIITDSRGTVTLWSPYIDPSYHISTLRNDKGESLVYDFSPYDELPDQGGNQRIDSSDLVGTWELAWTEVEGDRNEAEPGSCMIEIHSAASAGLLMSYTSQDFPDENFQNELLTIDMREMYPGCGNNAWVAELDYVGPYDTTYTITLTMDDILIKQNYFLVDSDPMVSYEYFRRGAE